MANHQLVHQGKSRRRERRRYADCGRGKRALPDFQHLERHTMLLGYMPPFQGSQFPQNMSYPKRRSWILAFSRKERKERKVYRDGGILEEFQINPPF